MFQNCHLSENCNKQENGNYQMLCFDRLFSSGYVFRSGHSTDHDSESVK